MPVKAAERFADAAVLWNAAEMTERRKDTQVARKIVLALPVDRGITQADRIALVWTFAQQQFVEKGLAGQIDLHVPHDAETESETTNSMGIC